MKKIIVPTDFSENATAAIEYACELAKSLKAAIVVANVHTPAVTHYNVISPLITEETGRAQKFAEERLQSIAKLIQKQYGVNVTTKFLVGGMVESIESLIGDSSAEMVVMGTKGASGIEKILFGSNTSRVIEKVKCPVLAVPVNCPFALPKKIMYATDFHNEELGHLTTLTTIAGVFNAEIMMTHITTDRSALESEEMLKRNFANRVSALSDYKPINFFVKYEDDIARALDSILGQVNADWIAMFTRDRTLFEKLYNPSLTKAMAHQTRVPLLAIKA